MDLDTLPVLSLAEAPTRFSDEIGASFRAFGFALVRDHGIDAALIADPLPDSHPLSELPAGTQVILLAAAAPDFALVRDSDGRTGYVARTALAARQP